MIVVAALILLCLLLVAYCFVLYPILIRVLARHYPEGTIIDESFQPPISIILSVHNEERVIERCLDSLLSLEYPKDKIELLIGSDGSTDRTNSIIEGYASKHFFIKPFYFQDQRGKIAVLNDIVLKASNEILMFLDADIVLSANTLLAHSRHYADPSVGAVAGYYQITSSQEVTSLSRSEEEYTSFEQHIRTDESMFHSTIGLAGCNYTLRRSLWKALPDNKVHDDLFVVLSVLNQHYRVYFEPASVATELFSRTLSEEFKRKSRFASRGYHTFSFFPSLLLPRMGRTAFLLWSHKLLRWSSPFVILAAILLLIIGYLQFSTQFFLLGLALVAIFLTIALLGVLAEKVHVHIPGVRQLSWLIVMIAAYAFGTVRYLTGKDDEIWVSAVRPPLESKH